MFCSESVWHGPSHPQISSLAVNRICSKPIHKKHPNISPFWRVCLQTASAAVTCSPAFIFWIIPEDRSGGPLTGLPEQKANTTLFLFRRRKTEHNSSGRDPAQCCWDNGKCGGAGKQKKCTAEHSRLRHLLEIWALTCKYALKLISVFFALQIQSWPEAVVLLFPQWRIRNPPTYPSRRWSSSKDLLPSSKGHSGHLISCGRSTASTPTK